MDRATHRGPWPNFHEVDLMLAKQGRLFKGNVEIRRNQNTHNPSVFRLNKADHIFEKFPRDGVPRYSLAY